MNELTIKDIRNGIKTIKKGYWAIIPMVIKSHYTHEEYCRKTSFFGFFKLCDCGQNQVIDDYIDKFEWRQGNSELMVLDENTVKDIQKLLR